MKIRTWLTVAATALATVLAAPASAQSNYPDRPIRLIVPFPPGGTSDVVGRIFAEALGKQIGQPVVVENRGGAGGTVGSRAVASATPDGYTLLLGSTNEMVVARMINSAVKYDGAKDFTALGVIATQPMVLAASKNSGVKTAAEYLQKLRATAPGSFNYGSSGVGTTLHLAGEMINQETSTRAEHVPYRGVSPLVTDLMSGQLDFGMLVLSSGLPQVRAEKIVALGVTQPKRSPVAPDIPALAETPGFEAVDLSITFSLYGPAGLPEPVAAKLREALADTLKSEQFRAKMLEAGGVLAQPGLDPVASQAAETRKYGALVKAAKIEAQ